MMFSRSVIKAALCTAALSFTALPASAQFAFGGDAPVSVSADKADYRGRLTILTGQVEVVQGDVRVLANRMELYRADLGGGRLGDINRIDAEGDFYYITPNEKVRGNKGVYEQAADRITVTGNVVLEQDTGNLVSGEKLVYNLTSKQAQLDGNCKGRACQSGRVSMVIERGNSSGN